MQRQTITPWTALLVGSMAFAKHPLLALIGSVWCAVAAVVLVWVVFPFSAMLAFPLIGGAHILMLNVLRDNKPHPRDLLVGFRDFWRWSGTGFHLTLYAAVCFGPGFLVLSAIAPSLIWPGGGAAGQGAPATPGSYLTLQAMVLAVSAIGMAFFTKYSLAFFFAADGAAGRRSTRKSAEAANGLGLRLFLTYLALGIISPVGLANIGLAVRLTNGNAFGVTGWVVFGVALAVSAAVSFCALGAIYIRLAATGPAAKSRRRAA